MAVDNSNIKKIGQYALGILSSSIADCLRLRGGL